MSAPDRDLPETPKPDAASAAGDRASTGEPRELGGQGSNRGEGPGHGEGLAPRSPSLLARLGGTRRLRRELALGAAVTGLLAVSPFTPAAWVPSFALGALGGAAVVGWRLWQRWQAPEADASSDSLRLEVPRRVWLALAALALVFAPTFAWLFEQWRGNVWNNAHGMLVPVLMGYLAYQALRRDEPQPEDVPSPWGYAFVGPGLALLALDTALRTQYLAVAGLLLVLPGVSLLLLGVRRTRLLRVPLVLSIFMIPVPNTVATHLFLREITTSLVSPVIAAMGIPVLREDTVLFLPNATFLVADACSGFSALYAAVGISIVLAAGARSWSRKALLLAAAFPLAVACNVARVTFLVVAAHTYGLGLLDTPFHTGSGVASFWAVIVLLFLISDRESLRQRYA